MGDRRADIIIRNARLIDGGGGESRTGDIAVIDDRISAIGTVGRIAAAVEIDGRGLAVAPGFIDVHTHDDRAVLSNPLMACKVSQGVTTVVTGNCGISIAPLSPSETPPSPADLIGDRPEHYFKTFGEYLDALDADPPMWLRRSAIRRYAWGRWTVSIAPRPRRRSGPCGAPSKTRSPPARSA